MATISEVKWYQTSEGKCPGCGRIRPLGRVNLADAYSQEERCIDCHFGPPYYYWSICPKCNEAYPGEKCQNCGYTGPAAPVGGKETGRLTK